MSQWYNFASMRFGPLTILCIFDIIVTHVFSRYGFQTGTRTTGGIWVYPSGTWGFVCSVNYFFFFFSCDVVPKVGSRATWGASEVLQWGLQRLFLNKVYWKKESKIVKNVQWGKNNLFYHQVCKLFHLRRRERFVIWITVHLQLWETNVINK